MTILDVDHRSTREDFETVQLMFGTPGPKRFVARLGTLADTLTMSVTRQPEKNR